MIYSKIVISLLEVPKFHLDKAVEGSKPGAQLGLMGATANIGGLVIHEGISLLENFDSSMPEAAKLLLLGTTVGALVGAVINGFSPISRISERAIRALAHWKPRVNTLIAAGAAIWGTGVLTSSPLEMGIGGATVLSFLLLDRVADI